MLKHNFHAVWRVNLPAATEDFEYSIAAQTADARSLFGPATAPQLTQTAIVVPL